MMGAIGGVVVVMTGSCPVVDIARSAEPWLYRAGLLFVVSGLAATSKNDERYGPISRRFHAPNLPGTWLSEAKLKDESLYSGRVHCFHTFRF